MRTFHCTHCGLQVFFENTRCLRCGRTLAYLPDLATMASLEPKDHGRWETPLAQSSAEGYRLCEHYQATHICNWVIPANEPATLCASCRLTRVIPDLTREGATEAWFRIEAAKRRLLVSLDALGLPRAPDHATGAPGLTFEFRADAGTEFNTVSTGHRDGVITIDLAEADDAERERRRQAVREPYRTILGHLRHESGHYYWDRLVGRTPSCDAFRQIFGDDREDYAMALARYYDYGPVPDWPARFVSAYATAHPWEDWAETWAHYLHMVDAVETAAACGFSLTPTRADEPSLLLRPSDEATWRLPFDALIEIWRPLTYALNSLNRSLGLADAYPFALAPEAVEKLRFVHGLVSR